MEKTFRKSREISGNRYHAIRDCVQEQKPFAIYNFLNQKQYTAFLKDLDNFGRLNYVLQVLHAVDPRTGLRRLRVPSIFITNEGTDVSLDDFKQIVRGSMTHYNLDSVICLYDGQVEAFYRNGDHHYIGGDIYSSSQIGEFQSDFYQLQGIYYTFVS